MTDYANYHVAKAKTLFTKPYLEVRHVCTACGPSFLLNPSSSLISSSAIANHDVIITRFSGFAALPLACLGFACSNFAKKNKRLLAV